MTREEAISWLKHCATTKCENCVNEIFPEEYCDDMQLKCVEALEEYKADDAENPKCDLISREEAKAEIRKRFPNLIDRIKINTVLNELPSIPMFAESAEAYKEWLGYYWENLGEDDTDEMYGECRWDSDEMPNADDFCSYGERREE